MDEQFIKKLMSTLNCGVCGQNYQTNDVIILGHKDKMWFLSLSCSTCRAQALVAAVIKESRQGKIVTDLTETELVKFANENSISTDDVLDIHNFLKDFKGDFSKLFNKD